MPHPETSHDRAYERRVIALLICARKWLEDELHLESAAMWHEWMGEILNEFPTTLVNLVRDELDPQMRSSGDGLNKAGAIVCMHQTGTPARELWFEFRNWLIERGEQ